ncbi:DUF424 domain-containing protein [Methanolapillus millepedarum]|uniref:DUF424 domain-containing protein n=1 Tax=Methanolapillus millepedarum TaxID=3028296 RepID=A0AA96V262_9EURY|nr:hypothetical protein MsAc7_06170 [Methanosarcinaceae archaeon Ac7]
MYVKTYKTEKHFMVAVCDRELVGQKLKNESCEINVNASFYQGSEADEETVIPLLLSATTANLIGKKAVACAIDCGLVDEDSLIYFDDIPHALYISI